MLSVNANIFSRVLLKIANLINLIKCFKDLIFVKFAFKNLNRYELLY